VKLHRRAPKGMLIAPQLRHAWMRALIRIEHVPRPFVDIFG